MNDIVTFKDLVLLVVFGGAAPGLAYALTKWLRAKKPQWTYLGTWFSSVGVAVVLAWLFWAIGLAMLYIPVPGVLPTAWRAWVEAAFAVAWPVGTIAAGIYAANKNKELPNAGRDI
jgi:hypothetical protein